MSEPNSRGKVVAVLTGAISIAIALLYLLVVLLLDSRGEMLPAPLGWALGFVGG